MSFRRWCARSLVLSALVLVSGCASDPEPASFEFETMGTLARCDLALPDGMTAPEAQTMVTAVYDSVTAVFSTWHPDTELSRLNRAPADSAVNLSPWLFQCLDQAERIRILSEGAFDPTAEPLMRLWGFYQREGQLPSDTEIDSARALMGDWAFTGDSEATKRKADTRFDLGGIAKGYAVDLAAASLRNAGVTDGLVDLGGNLFCLGGAPEREDWRVGIRDPLDRTTYFASVTVSGQAVATSGSYERFVTIDGERYGHIMNPATGRPAKGVLGVTVFAETAALADALSTALFVQGHGVGRIFLKLLPDPVDVLMVIPGREGEKARVLYTPGLLGRITLLEDYADTYDLVEWR